MLKVWLVIVGLTPNGFELIHAVENDSWAECEHLKHSYEFTYFTPNKYLNVVFYCQEE